MTFDFTRCFSGALFCLVDDSFAQQKHLKEELTQRRRGAKNREGYADLFFFEWLAWIDTVLGGLA
ncbi:hypothetical protein EH223_03455 [candidate division KSB1 bacterium]|nr:MAG: hypothetical protein EH223_03455 [candidate division KSB1 bacterium]